MDWWRNLDSDMKTGILGIAGTFIVAFALGAWLL